VSGSCDFYSISDSHPFFHLESSLYTHRALAYSAFEDTCLTILDVDGPAWADKLRKRVSDRSVKFRDSSPTTVVSDENTSLLNVV